MVDKDADGEISRFELIKALRTKQTVRDVLGLGPVVQDGDGTRDAFEEVFQKMDSDSSKTITLKEFVRCDAAPACPCTSTGT